MEIVIVAAVADNGVIGRDNDMPWRLKSDLQRFRARTTGKPLLMGRRTYQSLGRPLKSRTNIVVSRDPEFSAPGIVVAPCLESALAVARGDALRRGVNEITIIGGSHIYAALMPTATRLDLTRVHASPAGDTFFPPIDPEVWQEVESLPQPRQPEDSAAFTCVTYKRRHPLPPEP
jgi:dihydrofolate reductase